MKIHEIDVLLRKPIGLCLVEQTISSHNIAKTNKNVRVIT